MVDEEKKDEKVYVIPLSHVRGLPDTRRASAAVKTVREYLKKHSKAAEVRLDGKLNSAIWSKGMTKPPSSVKVKVVVDDDVAVASLVE